MLRKIRPRLKRSSIVNIIDNYIYDFIDLTELNFRGASIPHLA